MIPVLIELTRCSPLVLTLRPFRPRPQSDQAADGQQAAAPEQSQEPSEVKQTEASEGPQTNGEAAEGQGQKPRRQIRRRRQRNSESSTSKVSVYVRWTPPGFLWSTDLGNVNKNVWKK